MRKTVLKYTVAAFVISAAGFAGFNYIGGHGHVAEASEAAEAHTAPMAMPVDVTTIKAQQVELWKNYSGHVVAVDHADIRPQVSGRITEIHFKDGQHVEKGDVLMVIDPRPYQARLNQAKASLQAAKTQANLAEKEYQRAVKLINTDAISQSMLDERTNNRESAAAAVKGAEAAVESAEIDLDYAHVKAPISGKISRAEITEGNLVQAGGNAPVLTSIVADDKVYVDFEVDERTYIESVKSTQNKDVSIIPVRVKTLGAESEYQGTVHSFDNHIDTASGTVRARAIFDNKDGVLLPGMSVSVLMGTADGTDKILVTERAIGTDQDRKFVYVIGDDQTAQYREVKIGESVSGQRVIISGLEEGENIISAGIVRIRPGMPVMPKTAEQAE
ncbi:MAG: efflux RND transporter periplasmic adaptor subunit [Pseudomonadota bacterium]|nr:efflux RND transporter periplasmic adaptor subunit [Pseudomonadota bacterium]MEC9235970.1 efflux RND transporter periplasmic adaptor subunit [Pseudomonadota bacterium]MED5422084.1 efflux RND transporter periplasmic adaptor subunit [Pseudomonadota bacterium]